MQIRDPYLPHREDKHGAKAAVDAGAEESDEDESSDEEEDETRGTISYAMISSVVTGSTRHVPWHYDVWQTFKLLVQSLIRMEYIQCM